MWLTTIARKIGDGRSDEIVCSYIMNVYKATFERFPRDHESTGRVVSDTLFIVANQLSQAAEYMENLPEAPHTFGLRIEELGAARIQELKYSLQRLLTKAQVVLEHKENPMVRDNELECLIEELKSVLKIYGM